MLLHDNKNWTFWQVFFHDSNKYSLLSFVIFFRKAYFFQSLIDFLFEIDKSTDFVRKSLAQLKNKKWIQFQNIIHNIYKKRSC